MQWGLPLTARGLINADKNENNNVEVNAFEASLFNKQQLVSLAY